MINVRTNFVSLIKNLSLNYLLLTYKSLDFDKDLTEYFLDGHYG